MTLLKRIEHIQQTIHEVERSCHRQSDSVALLAVSKGQSCELIEQAFHAGLHHFGENYLQEALEKIQLLHSLPLHWHFIGAIQSNKVPAIAQHFSWVHGVCRKKIAQLLHDHRPDSLPALNVCMQINIDDSDTKSGIQPESAEELAHYITQLPRIHLRGLMVITRPMVDEDQQYKTYLRVTELFDKLNAKLGLSMDTLSMGMSDDLSVAIRAGSTLVRVGRGIFGERKKNEH